MSDTERTAAGTHPEHETAALGGRSRTLGGVGNNVGNDTADQRRRWLWRWLRRRSEQWVAPCRDDARRRRQLLVVLTGDGRVGLVVPPGEVAVLDLLAVGALRAALREAVFAVADPDTAHPRTSSVATVRRSA